MKTRNYTFSMGRVYRAAILGCTVAMVSMPAQAAYHFWNIREVYTDTSGSLQFIELFDSFGGQPYVGGRQIRVSNSGGTDTHTFTVPNDTPNDTFNHALLFGTLGLHAAGGPTP